MTRYFPVPFTSNLSMETSVGEGPLLMTLECAYLSPDRKHSVSELMDALSITLRMKIMSDWYTEGVTKGASADSNQTGTSLPALRRFSKGR